MNEEVQEPAQIDAVNDAAKPASLATHPSGKRCVSPLNGTDLTATMWKPGQRGGPGRSKGLRARLREYMEQQDSDTGQERYSGFIQSLDANARNGNGAAITGTIKLLDEEDVPSEIRVVIVDGTNRGSKPDEQ